MEILPSRTRRSIWKVQKVFGALLVLATAVVSQEIDTSSDVPLVSTSFTSCGYDALTERFTPTTFDVSLTPSNRTLSYSLNGTSTFSGNTTLELGIEASGVEAYRVFVDPCDAGYAYLCPSNSGPLEVLSSQEIPGNTVSYLEGKNLGSLEVRVQLNVTRGGEWGCVVARFGSNSTASTNGTATAGDGGEGSSNGTMGASGDWTGGDGNSSDASGRGDQSDAARQGVFGTGLMAMVMMVVLMVSGDLLL